jgi:hypothetical protein
MQRKDELDIENKQTQTNINMMGAYAVTATKLIELKYDLASLNSLKKTVEKYGGPLELFDAMGVYDGVKELKQHNTNLRTSIQYLDDRLSEKTAELAAIESRIDTANQRMGMIEANQGKAIQAQIIYQLMVDPESLEVDATKFKRTLLHFLIGARQYGQINREKLGVWISIEGFFDLLINGLTKIT